MGDTTAALGFGYVSMGTPVDIDEVPPDPRPPTSLLPGDPVVTNPRPLLAPLSALALALACADAASQSVVVELRGMPGSRGLVGQGQGGFTGPPFEAIAGQLGQSCALVDANGDGIDDLLVGAPGVPRNPTAGIEDDAGRAYLLYGIPGKGSVTSSPDMNFSEIAGTGEGLDIRGQAGDMAGTAVAAAGDVNDDGFDDFVVGTPGRSVSRSAAGGAYVVFGGPGLANFDLVDLEQLRISGQAVFLEGARQFAAAGSAVSGDVDVNGDGVDDVVIGAPLESTDTIQQAGAAYVVYGVDGLESASSIDLAQLAPGEATIVRGSEPFQLLGQSVAGLGAFDPVLPMTANQTSALGDDVAIGAPGTSAGGALFAGAVYVLRGTDGTPALEYSASQFGNGTGTPGVVYSGAEAGDQAGFSVGRTGDLLDDGEGFEELLIAAPFNDGVGRPNSGTAYVVPGRIGGANPQGFGLGTLAGSGAPGFVLYGAQSNDGQQGVFGIGAGDWTADGRPEFAVAHANATYVGDGFVALSAGRVRVLDAAVIEAAGGEVDLAFPPAKAVVLELAGESDLSYAGTGLAVGDFNGDGRPDLGLGAPGAPSDPTPLDPTGIALTETGRGHVVYGPVYRVAGVTPDRGSQFSGVFNADFLPDYPGEEADEIEVVVNAGPVFGLEDVTRVEIGSDELGWKDVPVTAVDFPNIVGELPPDLLGTQDTLVDVRITVAGIEGFGEDAFTYEASAFREIAEFAQPGFGFGPDDKAPRVLMAGDFVESGQVLLRLDQWAPEVELGVLVFGPSLDPTPPTVKGGLFPVEFFPAFVLFFPFPGAPGFDASIDMPFFIDPVLEGTSVYIHALTKERSGNEVRWGFSNVLEATFVLAGFP